MALAKPTFTEAQRQSGFDRIAAFFMRQWKTP